MSPARRKSVKATSNQQYWYIGYFYTRLISYPSLVRKTWYLELLNLT